MFLKRLFKSKAERELDAILDELRANLENNYKSTAQAAREKLGRRCEELHDAGQLDLHAAWKVEVPRGLQQVGNASLAGLRIHAAAGREVQLLDRNQHRRAACRRRSNRIQRLYCDRQIRSAAAIQYHFL